MPSDVFSDLKTYGVTTINSLYWVQVYKLHLLASAYIIICSTDPTIVTVNMYIRSLSHIDLTNMEYRVQMTFRQQWSDAKLSYGLNMSIGEIPDFLIVPENMHDFVWKPDTFLQNEIDTKVHTFDKPNRLIRIYPDGQILMSTRLTTTLTCPMSLNNYPFDSQTCHIDLASYAFSTVDIVYQWKGDTPIQKKHGLERSLAEFRIHSVLSGYCTSITSTGEYSCLRASILLERSIAYHIIHFFMPCIATVFLSFSVFWLDDLIPRLMTGLATLLLIGLVTIHSTSGLPRVSYLTAADVWLLACTMLISFSVAETVVVHYLSRKDVEKRRIPEREDARNFPDQHAEASKRIDTVSRLAFPVIFFIFSCLYFFAYVYRR